MKFDWIILKIKINYWPWTAATLYWLKIVQSVSTIVEDKTNKTNQCKKRCWGDPALCFLLILWCRSWEMDKVRHSRKVFKLQEGDVIILHFKEK